MKPELVLFSERDFRCLPLLIAVVSSTVETCDFLDLSALENSSNLVGLVPLHSISRVDDEVAVLSVQLDRVHVWVPRRRAGLR